MTNCVKKRAKLAELLDKVSADVTEEFQNIGLSMPIFLIVPSTGNALVTFGTPADPSDEDWEAASKIVIRVVATHAGGDIKLVANELTCAAAGSPNHVDGRASSAI
jgi:hypothetical protein